MNQPGTDHERSGLDWRAIALGAGTSLAVGFAVSYLSRFLPLPTSLAMVVWPVLGLVNDALGGAVAGFMARRRGVAHGAVACLLASIAATAITLVRILGVTHGATLGSYFLTLPFWLALGIAVGAGAGALAVRAASAAPRE